MPKETLLLSREDIDAMIDIEEVIATTESVFRAHGEGKVIMPAKITLDMGNAGLTGWINAMPAYVGPSNAAGIKWAGGFIDNPSLHGLSYVMATIILNDPQTGVPEAVMDGIQITNLRTGAVPAVCAKYLGKKETRKAGIIGCGTQGRTSLRCLARTAPIDTVMAYDILPEARDRYALEMSADLGLKIVPVDNPRLACEGMDIIVTATQADEAIVRKEWFEEGGLIVSLGSYQELDEAIVLSADKIVVDSWAQCSHRGELAKLAESGRLGEDHIYAELGEIVAGKKAGRESEAERILAVPIGLGSLDIALAKKMVQRAKETGRGGTFNFLSS